MVAGRVLSWLPAWARYGVRLRRTTPWPTWENPAYAIINTLSEDIIGLVVYNANHHTLGGQNLWRHDKGKMWDDSDFEEIIPPTVWDRILEPSV